MTLVEELRFDLNLTESADGSAPSGGSSATPSSSPAPPWPPRVSNPFGLIEPNMLDPTFQHLLQSIVALPAEAAIATIGRYSRILTATEADIIANHQESGASPRDTETLIGKGGKRSKKAKKQRAKRGDTLRNNPELKDDIESGAVSEEQLDDLADADSKTDGAASKDPELLDELRNSNPDQSKETVKEFVNHHNKPEEESEHQRQRRLRKISRYTTKDGIDAIWAGGDKATIDAIWAVVRGRANDLYRKDGGRDVAPSKHPRTHARRLFDAFAQHFTDDAAPANKQSKGSGRPAIVINATLNNHGEIVDPHLIGSGPLPRSVFDRYFCNATVVGMLFDGNGQPLWQGKRHRWATPAQYVALVARDGGCVLCKAHLRPATPEEIAPKRKPEPNSKQNRPGSQDP